MSQRACWQEETINVKKNGGRFEISAPKSPCTIYFSSGLGEKNPCWETLERGVGTNSPAVDYISVSDIDYRFRSIFFLALIPWGSQHVIHDCRAAETTMLACNADSLCHIHLIAPARRRLLPLKRGAPPTSVTSVNNIYWLNIAIP